MVCAKLGFGDMILFFVRFSLSIWNGANRLLFNNLTKTPENFSGGAAWSKLMEFDWIFKGVGASLVATFMLVSFCMESIDLKESFRAENLLGYFIRLSVAEVLVVFHAEIVQEVFKITGGMVKLLLGSSAFGLTLTPEQEQCLLNFNVNSWTEILDILAGLIVLLLAFIVLLIMLVMAGGIFFITYFRFIRILIMVPYGALAFSTVSGNRIFNETAINYIKNMLVLALDGVTMALALVVCNAFVSGGNIVPLPDNKILEGWLSMGEACITMFEMVITVGITAGMVGTADRLTTRLFRIV